MRPSISRVAAVLVAIALLLGVGRAAPAAPEGIITPFMVLYGLHDALVKPMPAGRNTASLAESWTSSKDGLAYEFVIRKGVRFHNGDPVTAADVKFSFERYGKLLGYGGAELDALRRDGVI